MEMNITRDVRKIKISDNWTQPVSSANVVLLKFGTAKRKERQRKKDYNPAIILSHHIERGKLKNRTC